MLQKQQLFLNGILLYIFFLRCFTFSQISSVNVGHVYGWETVVLSLPKMALKTCCSTMHVGAEYLWLQLLRYVEGKHISKKC